MELDQKRPLLTYLNIARLFAIYWVVLVQHNFAPYHKFWSWVGNGEYYFNPLIGVSKYITPVTMPLCFFISGFILEYGGKIDKMSFKAFMAEKIKRLLIPCYFFGALFCFLQTRTLSYYVLIGYSHLWFLFDLFLFFLATYFLLKWKNQAWYVCLLLLISFSLYLSTNLLHSGFLSNAAYYYIWFLLGFIASTMSGKKNNNVIVFLLVACCCYVLSSTIVSEGKLEIYWKVYPFFALPLFLFIFKMCSKTNKIESSKIFMMLNASSYGVYIFHMMFLFIFYKLFVVFGLDDCLIKCRFWLSSVMAMATIPLSIVTTVFLRKLF